MSSVLLLNQFGEMGGGERLLFDVATYLQPRWQVSAMMPAGRFTDQLAASGVQVTPLSIPALQSGRKSLIDVFKFGLALMGLASKMKKQVKQSGVDVIYVNAPRLLLPALMASRQTGRPVVAAMHLVFSGREQQLLDRWLRDPQIAATTFCSQAAMNAFSDLPRAQVLYNWVNRDFLAPSVPAPEETVVGVLGRMSANKGQGILIQALQGALPLKVAGDTDFENPDEAPRLRELAKDLPVEFVGKVDARAFFDSIQIAVVPTMGTEAFGLTAVEAMARSRPVVVTDVGGLPEIVEHERSGLIAQPTREGLREAILRLAGDADLRVALAQAGRVRVEQNFHPDVQLPKVERLLTESTSSRRS